MESITIHDFAKKIAPYTLTMLHYEEEKRAVNKTLSKIAEQLFKDYLSNLVVDIGVKNLKAFAELDPVQITFICPEIVYFVEFIDYHYEHLTNHKIIIRQLAVSREAIQHKSYLQLVALHSIYTSENKLNAKKIDSVLLNGKKVVAGAKKSSTGTLFGIQTSRYFKPKPKNAENEIIEIDVLRGKKNGKNYLLPTADEIIVVSCPICKDEHKFVYNGMQKVLQYDKARNVVKVRCNHKLQYGSSYEINVAPFGLEKYTVKDILMFVINNRRYFGLQKPRCKA
jgi:hypothetical protein